jgi:tyrosyl-tRNA synthetase
MRKPGWYSVTGLDVELPFATIRSNPANFGVSAPMNLFEDLKWRKVVNQITHDELAQRIEKEQLTLYAGFDPTADSLHVGSLLPLLALVRFQKAGHTPILLMGGGTGLIGDPSGKTAERLLLDQAAVEANVQGIRLQSEKFLDFGGKNAAVVVNNADWLCQLNLLDFLRDVGKHFSVNVMLARDSVRQRLEDRDHGISYTEFSYCLLQAYDFLHLFDTRGCRLQIGGSDQWGNIVSGMDLTRRLRPGATTFGLTIPLVTKSDGAKFGKSESGNIWLDARRTSPYKFYQFWINQSDADVPAYLRYFTFLDREEIEAQEHNLQSAPEKREAQRKLAEEVTRLVHGADGLAKAINATQAMFSGDFSELDIETLQDVLSDMPSSDVPESVIHSERPLVEVLVEAGVFASKGEVRRLIQNGGLSFNNVRVSEDSMKLTREAVGDRSIAVVRKGKKHYHLLRFAK